MVEFEREHEVRQLRPGVAGEPLIPAVGREVLEIDLAPGGDAAADSYHPSARSREQRRRSSPVSAK
jgi:hypothetical protein